MSKDDLQAVVRRMLTATPPTLTEKEAAQIANRHFGIEGRLKPLVSDRDQNFMLEAVDGQRFVLKIANHTEPPQSLDFQNQALAHVKRHDPSLPLPRVIPDRDGNGFTSLESDGKTHLVRVVSWLEGVPMEHCAPGPGVERRLGELLARLDRALEDFEHPASDPFSAWDMKHAGELALLLEHIEEPSLGSLVADVLQRFTTRVEPLTGKLRTQVVHNDMNPGNILLDSDDPGRISGIIDFGDLVRTPLIFDLAIAAAYQLSEDADPLAGALPLIAGFNAVSPLQAIEMDLLTDLIRTRLVTSLLINSYRVKLFPENRDYLLVSYAAVKCSLAGLDKLGEREALERIREACSNT
jgi:Ser/Thr protein kinase RdoA (MazF antagonist)